MTRSQRKGSGYFWRGAGALAALALLLAFTAKTRADDKPPVSPLDGAQWLEPDAVRGFVDGAREVRLDTQPDVFEVIGHGRGRPAPSSALSGTDRGRIREGSGGATIPKALAPAERSAGGVSQMARKKLGPLRGLYSGDAWRPA